MLSHFNDINYTKPQNQNNYNNYPSPSHEGHVAANFSDKKTRKDFIRKVFGILGLQLLVTTLIGMIPHFVPSFKIFLREKWYIALICFIIAIAILYAINYTKIGRKVPANYIILVVFTLCIGYCVAYLVSRYDPDTVILAIGLTCAMVFGLALYATFTKTDFTKCGGFLMVLGIVLLGACIAGYFFRNKWFHLAICIIGVFVYGLYLVFDIQLLIGNKKHKFSRDDYVLAALMLYTDIISMFIYILQIMGLVGR